MTPFQVSGRTPGSGRAHPRHRDEVRTHTAPVESLPQRRPRSPSASEPGGTWDDRLALAALAVFIGFFAPWSLPL